MEYINIFNQNSVDICVMNTENNYVYYHNEPSQIMYMITQSVYILFPKDASPYLGIILFTTFFSLSCSDSTDVCNKDTDCREGRVCQANNCIEANRSRSCGEVALQCSCNYTPYYPGNINPSNLCESGYQQYFTCQGLCYGGYPWGTRCYCG